MGSLGKFGTARPVVEESFDWFDAEIRVHPDLSDLAIIDLFAAMQDVDEDDNASGVLAAMGSISSTLIHPDDVEAFMRIARANRQTMEDIVRLAMEVLGALAGRPTLLPSVSSDGRQATAPTSMGDSSEKALHALAGRPDLQVAVLRRQAG